MTLATKMKPMPTKNPKALIAAAAPFARVANIIDTLPEWTDADLPLRSFMPGIWPTVGDARKLRDELVRLGWKP